MNAATWKINRSRRRGGFTLVEILVVIGILAMLAAILVPAVNSSRETTRKSLCANNLRQMALAAQAYNQAADRLPAARMTDSGGYNGTFLILLPYLDQEAAAKAFDEKLAYQATPENQRIVNTRINTYLCPSMSLPREVPDPDPNCHEVGAPGSYAVCTGSDSSFMFPGIPPHNGAIVHAKFGETSIGRIASNDGTSSTLMFGEMNYGLEDYYWQVGKPPNTPKWGETRWAVGYPGITWASSAGKLNSRQLLTPWHDILTKEFESFRSDHKEGVNFAFVDGSVRFLQDTIDPVVLDSLATRNGGERIPPNAY